MIAFSNNSLDSNSTTNNSQFLGFVDSCSRQSSAIKVVKITSYAFISLVALLGNIFVILVICRNKKLRKAINLFILNMAISDLCFPAVVIPMHIYSLHLNVPTGSGAWPLGGITGDILCKISMFLADSSPIISILSLVFMAADRFYAVVFPLKANRIRFRIRVSMLVCSWVVAFCFISPYFRIFRVIVSSDQKYCRLSWPPPYDHTSSMQAYSTILLVVFTIIPFVLLTIMYSIMLLILRKQTVTGPLVRSASIRRQRNNRNVILMAFAIVIVFAICWGPYNGFLFLVNIIWQWKLPPKFHQIDTESFLFTVLFLTCCNAALNPCMYFIFIHKYRTALKRLFCGKSEANLSHKNTFSDSQNWQVKTRRHISDSTVKQHNNRGELV